MKKRQKMIFNIIEEDTNEKIVVSIFNSRNIRLSKKFNTRKIYYKYSDFQPSLQPIMLNLFRY